MNIRTFLKNLLFIISCITFLNGQILERTQKYDALIQTEQQKIENFKKQGEPHRAYYEREKRQLDQLKYRRAHGGTVYPNDMNYQLNRVTASPYLSFLNKIEAAKKRIEELRAGREGTEKIYEMLTHARQEIADAEKQAGSLAKEYEQAKQNLEAEKKKPRNIFSRHIQLGERQRIFEYKRKAYQPYLSRITSAKKRIKELEAMQAQKIAENEKARALERKQLSLRQEQALLEKEKQTTAPPPGKGEPLHYGTLLQLGCRGIKGRNTSTWPTAWTHAESPWWTNMSGHMEILLNGPPGETRGINGGQLLMLRRAGDPTNTDQIKFGDEVELWSMYAAAGKAESNLGIGRKWWVFEGASDWYGGYPCIIVGPNDDAWGLQSEKKPRPESGREIFTLESSHGRRIGDVVTSGDVIRVKTSNAHPALKNKYLWTNPDHKKWGNGYWQILIAGPNGIDMFGLNAIGKDRSTTSRNQFVLKEAQLTQAVREPFLAAQKFTLSYLPQGTVVSLKTAHGTYLRADGSALKGDASDFSDAGAQFEVLYQAHGWIGLRNRKTKKFLQATNESVNVAGTSFEKQTDIATHWYLDGSLSSAILRNESAHKNLGIDPNGNAYIKENRETWERFTLRIISRPINEMSPIIELVSARYGAGTTWLDVAASLTTLLEANQGRHLYLHADQFETNFGDPSPGAQKDLVLSYKVHGKLQTLRIPHGENLNLAHSPLSAQQAQLLKQQRKRKEIAQLSGIPFVLKAPNQKYVTRIGDAHVKAIGTDSNDPAALFQLELHGNTVGLKTMGAVGTFLAAQPNMTTALVKGPLSAQPLAAWNIEQEGENIYFKHAKLGGYLSILNDTFVVGQFGQAARKGDWAKFVRIPLSPLEVQLGTAQKQPTVQQSIAILLGLVNKATQPREKTALIREVETLVNKRTQKDIPSLTNLLNSIKYNPNFRDTQFTSYINEVLDLLTIDKTRSVTIAQKQKQVAWLTHDSFKLPAPGSGTIVFEMKAEENAYFGFHTDTTPRMIEQCTYSLHLGVLKNQRTDIRKHGTIQKSFLAAENIKKKDKSFVDPEINKQAIILADGQFQLYWISIDKGTISFGRNTMPGAQPVFTWKDSETLPVTRIGLSCHKKPVALRALEVKQFVPTVQIPEPQVDEEFKLDDDFAKALDVDQDIDLSIEEVKTPDTVRPTDDLEDISEEEFKLNEELVDEEELDLSTEEEKETSKPWWAE